MHVMVSGVLVAAALMLAAGSVRAAEPQTLMEMFGGQPTRADPRYQMTPSDPCNIVVLRPGGNPTQDMPGSIGHAKSYQANGGPRRKTICRFTGSRY